MIRLAFTYEQVGPYVVARMESLKAFDRVAVIELMQQGHTYGWKKIDKTRFRRITLLEDRSRDACNGALIARRVFRALQDQQPTCVVTTGWSRPIELAALDWCHRTGTPAVVMCDSQSQDNRRLAFIEGIKQRVVRLYSAALAGGTPHVTYLQQLGIPPSRIFTGCDVVDNEYFASGARAARAHDRETRERLRLPDNFFLACNRLLACKNLQRLLTAYAAYCSRVQADAWKLVILGDGKLQPRILSLRNRLGLNDNVLLPGFCQIQTLPAYYGLASAFILASTKETWGLVVNEAMAAGLPVLVSKRCGCATDLVEDGSNGFVFDPLDVGQLTELMTRISGDGCDLAPMRTASRRIIRHWSVERFSSGLAKAVDAAIAAPRRRPRLWERALLWALIRRPQTYRE